MQPPEECMPQAIIQQADQLRDHGNKAMKEGNYKAALFLYNQAMELTPCDVRLYTNRSLAHLHLRRWRDAEVDATTVLHWDQDNLKALLRRSRARENRGDLPGALDDMERARQLPRVFVCDTDLQEAQYHHIRLQHEIVKKQRQLEHIPLSCSVHESVMIEEMNTDVWCDVRVQRAMLVSQAKHQATLATHKHQNILKTHPAGGTTGVGTSTSTTTTTPHPARTTAPSSRTPTSTASPSPPTTPKGSSSSKKKNKKQR